MSVNPSEEADEANGHESGTRGLWRLVSTESPGGRPRIEVEPILPWLAARMRRLLGFIMLHVAAPLRNRDDEPSYARARAESVKIEEKYHYRQEISLNADVSAVGNPTGSIKITLPYDGDKFFTRDASADVDAARRGSTVPSTKAVVGFLALTDYEKTDLEEPLRLHANYGSVPIAVSLPEPRGQLTADNSECVICQEYQPEPPRILPAYVDMELDDPDTAESADRAWRSAAVDGIADLLARLQARRDVIEKAPERQLEFQPGLWLRMTVRLHLPRGQADGVEAKVSKVSLGWPTHTSLTSLKLTADSKSSLRYNPGQEQDGRNGGLEWADVPLTLVAADEPDSARTADGSGDESEGEDPGLAKELVTLTSGEMTLSITNPGDFYQQDTLTGQIEVKVNRLLSGMDARLHDATGRPYPAGSRALKLASVVTTEFTVSLSDAFARRAMSPYQWLYFDEVIPDAMRVDDIAMALRNRGFKVERRGANPANCTISATRVQGPGELRLQVNVRGDRYQARRDRKVDGGVVYRTAVDSGALRLYVYGSLRAESKPVVQEINALRRALRERFDRLPAGR